MTRADHPSGSDRIFEALQSLLDPDGRVEFVVNLQGDLPTIPPGDIRAALAPLDDAAVDIATLAAEIRKEEEHTNPSVVKRSARPSAAAGCARCISPAPPRPMATDRATIISGSTPIGGAALERFVKLPPSTLEQREKLEQLRAMEAGMRIDVTIVDSVPLRRRHPRRPRNRPRSPRSN